jgi:hypothetical protein
MSKCAFAPCDLFQFFKRYYRNPPMPPDPSEPSVEKELMLKVLNLGAGVQSTTVLLMSCEGVLPRLDCAVFADTGWEPEAVYEHLEWLKGVSTVPIHTVHAGNIKQDALVSQVRGKAEDGQRWASMPYYVDGNGDREGMIRRQCTKEYKIDPIERFIKKNLLGLTPGRRLPKEPVLQQWFGISRDEFTRTRKPEAAWKTHYYPLVGVEFVGDRMLLSDNIATLADSSMSRAGCLEWLADRGYPTPPRSACIGCPFHSDAEWREMKESRPVEFDDACTFDESTRNLGGMRGQVFLHRSCKPLREVDFRTDFDKGQLPLFEIGGVARDECLGMCGA